MFIFHIAISTGLIALAIGTSLYIWSQRQEGPGTGLARIFGFLIILLSITSMLCTSYYGVKYWHEGYFSKPMVISSIEN